MRYEIVDGEMSIFDEKGAIRWQGCPLGKPVKAVSPLPGAAGAVVLLDYTASAGQFENLIRIGPGGEVVWMAALRGAAGDAFVDLAWLNGELVAHTWSGHRLIIDVETGRTTLQAFTK